MFVEGFDLFVYELSVYFRDGFCVENEISNTFSIVVQYFFKAVYTFQREDTSSFCSASDRRR